MDERNPPVTVLRGLPLDQGPPWRGTEVLAILVDAENVPPASLPAVETALAKYKRQLRRIYGDWARSDLGPWRAIAEAHGYRLVQVTRLIAGKSSVDQGITIDAVDLLHDVRVTHICIVTNDTDFVPLLARLREAHVHTILAGDQRAPQGLKRAADEFLDISLPQPEKTEPERPAAKASTSVLPLLLEGYRDTERDGKANLAAFGAALKKRQPDFTTKEFGASRLLDLLARFPDTFQVLQETKGDDAPIHYVALRKPKNETPSKPAALVARKTGAKNNASTTLSPKSASRDDDDDDE